MENLTPPLLNAVREIRWRISAGRSMRESLRLFLNANSDDFAVQVREWWVLKSQGGSAAPFTGHLRQAFQELIERGCAGQPTLDQLSALEAEIELAAQAELDLHVSTLPFKVLLPLLFLQFPAYLILLLGPLLRDLSHSLGGTP